MFKSRFAMNMTAIYRLVAEKSMKFDEFSLN